MGANLRTFATRYAKRLEVRDSLVSWLGAKGFEICDENPLFPLDPETERGVVLSETQGWTIIAFSHSHEEGDRLVFELNKLHKPLLEVWVYDSDIWGYRLHDSGKLVASFNSNPRYFGGPAELELPRNGDPELLRETCELRVDSQRIDTIQRKRAVFSESVAARFCAEIGAEAAAYDYRDFEELAVKPGQYVTAGGIKIEQLFFVRRSTADRRSARRLHEILLRAPATATIDPEIAAWQAQVQRQMLPLTIALRTMMWGVRAVTWILGPLFLIWWRWKGAQQMRRGGLLQELLALREGPEVERQGTRLLNRRHGCSFALPDSAELLPDIGPGAVFRFRLGDVHVHCDAMHPSRLGEQLKVWPGSVILDDEKLFVGEFPARIVLLRALTAGRTREVVWHLVETPQAVYRFQASSEELSADARRQVREALESFRLEHAAP